MPGMGTAKAFRQENLDWLIDDFFTRVPEELFCVRIDQDNSPLAVDQDNPDGGGFHRHSEFLLRSSALGNVHGNAAHPQRFAIGVQFNAAARVHPTRLPTRRSDSIFGCVDHDIRYGHFGIIFDTAAQRILCHHPHRFPIIRMNPAPKSFRVEFLRWREAEKGPSLVIDPDLITCDVPHPQTEASCARRQIHPLHRFAQFSFARLQLPRDLCRAQHVTADLVAHRCYQAQI